tara:strand:- start:1988 stop:2878 length:891 start_codon:yes stop_codon:yes gene_type:complete
MRNTLINLIKKDFKNKNYFLTADLGFSILEDLQKISNKRFVNVGVAENSMFTLAIGISENLKKNESVYCYSISPFVVLRSLELIRNYLNFENRKIRLIGVGSGYSYSYLGKTHFLMEDLNIFFGFKNLIILNPGNERELKFVYDKYKNFNGPVYFRINKSDAVEYKKYNFLEKKGLFIKKGFGSNIIVSGYIFEYLKKIFSYDEIKKLNIISIPIFNQIYTDAALKYLNKKKPTILLVDNNQTLLFEKMKYEICNITNNKVWNIHLEPTKIKLVGNEFDLLSQSGLNIKKIRNYLL